ncbi:MAG TPA: efflux RND transporter periplasmic adaptor subunit, partial [Gammaproteobacteria bacterium]|nr:efflux RND transporter periplasmic adaptor subunit [Gammaproteobacteria bacterium]
MNTPHRPFNRRLSFWIVILVIILLIFFIRHVRLNANGAVVSPPSAVVTADVTTQEIPIYLTAIGTVTSTYSVTVRTQINGQLVQVLFKEGQMVKKGELLAQIDPRPYEAQLKQYEGQLERDTALLKNSQLDLQRYQTLWKQDSVAKQTLDTQAAVVQQNQGVVKIDEGLIESTKLNLTYCRITSPIDGRVGLRLVDPGNYVQVSDATGIAVITMTHPITVVFTIPEDNVSQVLDKMNAKIPLTILAFDRQQKKLLDTGKLITMD